MEAARSAYQTASGIGRLQQLDERLTPVEFHMMIEELLEEARAWSLDILRNEASLKSPRAVERLRAAEGASVSREYDEAALEGKVLLTSRNYASLMIGELLTNAFRYAHFDIRRRQVAAHIDIRTVGRRNLVQCTIANPVSDNPDLLRHLKRIGSSHETYLGITQLDWLSQGWDLPSPRIQITTESTGCYFSVAFDVAVVN